MEEALSFFRALEAWIYLLLGLGGLIYLRKFIIAWQELRGAAFGLERESAQARLNQAASVLVLLLTMAVAEFVLVSFIAPAVPGANPLPTATLNVLASPTTTLAADSTQVLEGGPTVSPNPTSSVAGSGCISGQIEITAPQNGASISDVVAVNGSATIPDFGFYKIEMKRPDQSSWLTVLAGNQPVTGGELGQWDTRRIPPGQYELGLIAYDNQAKPSDLCVIQVSITASTNTTTTP
jgi:hypothetical protein